MEQRLINEINHGKFLAQSGAGEIWNWTTPAGKIRWKRRVGMLCENIFPQHNVLEIGCGTGYFTKEIAQTKAKVTAIDLSPELLEIAKREVTDSNVTFLCENAYSTKFASASFDCIIGSSVLHHLDIDQALTEFYRVLKPGAFIRFTEPNMLNPQIALQKNIPALKKRLGDSPDETAFFKWQIGGLLKRHGFNHIKVVPFDFLHPQTPSLMIPLVNKLGNLIEHVPGMKEIAGSLYIEARKD